MTLQEYKTKYLTNLKELESRNLSAYEKIFVKDRKERVERFFAEALEPLEKNIITRKVEYLDFVDNEEDFNIEHVKILMFLYFVRINVQDINIFVKSIFNVDYNKFQQRAKEWLPTWELKDINDNYKYLQSNPTADDYKRGKD